MLQRGAARWSKVTLTLIRFCSYTPTLVKDNGHLMHLGGVAAADFVLETSFLLTPVNQFDQAGIMVHYSEGCWVKAGLEVCLCRCCWHVPGALFTPFPCVVRSTWTGSAGSVVSLPTMASVTGLHNRWVPALCVPFLSSFARCCALVLLERVALSLGSRLQQLQITFTMFSWLVLPPPCTQWEGFELRIRLHKTGSSFVCEYFQPLDSTWNFMRIFHLSGADSHVPSEVLSAARPRLGLMTCAPSGRGLVVDFHYVLVTECKGYHHTADPGDITYEP